MVYSGKSLHMLHPFSHLNPFTFFLLNKQPTFGVVEKGRILDIFRDRRKQRKKEAKKAVLGAGSTEGSTNVLNGSIVMKDDLGGGEDAVASVARHDGDLQSIGNRTSSTASSSSSTMPDGSTHDGKTIHVLKQQERDGGGGGSTNKLKKDRRKAKPKKIATSQTTVSEKADQSPGVFFESVGLSGSDNSKKMTKDSALKVADKGKKTGPEPTGNVAPSESAVETGTPDIKRKSVAPPPGFASSGLRSSVLKPMSPGKIGLRPSVISAPSQVSQVAKVLPIAESPFENGPTQPVQQQTLGKVSELPLQAQHTDIPAGPSISDFPPLSLPDRPISRSSSVLQAPTAGAPKPKEPVQRSASLHERLPGSAGVAQQQQRIGESPSLSILASERTIPPPPLNNSPSSPLVGQYIHLTPSSTPSHVEASPLPANPVELAKKFLDLYYPRLSSVNPAASLLPFYTPNSQKSISINGAHSVVTGHDNIAQQFLRSRHTIGGGNMQILSVVAQELHSMSSTTVCVAGGGGVLIVVTGMAHTQIPTSDQSSSSPPDSPTEAPSLMRYSCPFSHTVTLVPAAAVPVNVPSNEGSRQESNAFASLQPLSFSSAETPTVQVVGYQIHNDSLTLLSGDAYRSQL
jgi:hypothetical protein